MKQHRPHARFFPLLIVGFLANSLFAAESIDLPAKSDAARAAIRKAYYWKERFQAVSQKRLLISDRYQRLADSSDDADDESKFSLYAEASGLLEYLKTLRATEDRILHGYNTALADLREAVPYSELLKWFDYFEAKALSASENNQPQDARKFASVTSMISLAIQDEVGSQMRGHPCSEAVGRPTEHEDVRRNHILRYNWNRVVCLHRVANAVDPEATKRALALHEPVLRDLEIYELFDLILSPCPCDKPRGDCRAHKFIEMDQAMMRRLNRAQAVHAILGLRKQKIPQMKILSQKFDMMIPGAQEMCANAWEIIQRHDPFSQEQHEANVDDANLPSLISLSREMEIASADGSESVAITSARGEVTLPVMILADVLDQISSVHFKDQSQALADKRWGEQSTPMELALYMGSDPDLAAPGDRSWSFGSWQLEFDKDFYVRIVGGHDKSAWWRKRHESDTYQQMKAGLAPRGLDEKARQFLAGQAIDSEDDDADNARMIAAKFISEPARRWQTWVINLMLLDLVTDLYISWADFMELHPMQGGSFKHQASDHSNCNLNEIRLAEVNVMLKWLHVYWPLSESFEIKDRGLSAQRSGSSRCQAYALKIVADMIVHRLASTKRWDYKYVPADYESADHINWLDKKIARGGEIEAKDFDWLATAALAEVFDVQ